jgi:hypothetical protein
VSIPLISALEGTQQGVSRRSPGRSRLRELGRYVIHASPTDGRASLRGEYENSLIVQTPPDVTTRHSAGGSQAETTAPEHYVPTTRLRSPRLRDNYQGSTTATTPRYTSATQGNFQCNNVLGSPMFAFSRHNYYVQENIRPTRTPEEQHASPHRGNMDVRQYVYDVYVKSAELRRVQAYHAFSSFKQL